MTMLKNPVHPGTILKHEFLDPLGLSSYRLAGELGVPRTRIERLVAELTRVTPDTAMRLGKFFGTTPEFWMNLQTNHDMAKAAKTVDVSKITPLEYA